MLTRKGTTTSDSTIPSLLLAQAQAIASEHNELTSKLSKEYDARTAKRVGELSSVADALKDWNKASKVHYIRRKHHHGIC
jgi:peptide chain release factor 1